MIAYDLDGSYEEMPPNLVDELTRTGAGAVAI
jgi:membrane glycosyltransferase